MGYQGHYDDWTWLRIKVFRGHIDEPTFFHFHNLLDDSVFLA
jgi:hypothetical protein